MKRLLLLLLLTSCFLQSNASHLMGGEITWQCLPTGEYRFFMKLYRDCNGVSFPTTGISLDVSNKPGLTSIPMTIISQTDISPDCNSNSGIPITCAGATGSTAGAVEEFYFQSNPIILTGVPPAAGWIFSYSNCCRNAAITNLPNAGGLGFTLRAIMYSYNLQNANPCFDSSPFFVESPNTIICSGYPFTYNPTAIDPEIDSLVYSWAQPLDDFTGGAWTASNPAPIGFSPGYSFTSPLPGPAQNPNNVAATLNTSTGEVSYTSFTNGVFVTVNKVSAYKCGIVIAEIFRDLQITLKVCNSLSPGVPNLPPTVTKPFIDPVTGNFTLTTDTVYAGEVVNFLMSATDFDYHPLLATNDPSSGGFQRLVFVANGAEFGANYTNPNAGCIIPPCATLSPPPPQPPVLAATAVTFNWQTSCAHLGYTNGCVNFSNEYTFIIKSLDDFCPAPGITTTTVKIVVLAPPQLNSPIIRCTDVLANGDVSLTWTQPIDTVGSFDAYLIYHSTNAAGPFTLIDSIFNLTTTNYLHVGANASNAPQYYQIVTRDLCKAYRFSTPNQTSASIHLTASNSGGNASQLNWNAVNTPLLSSSSTMYYIYREYPVGTWTLIDSTSALNYLDPININACNDSINYRIEIRDSINCISVSSIDGAWFQNITQPDPPIMHCIEADNNGSVTLSWVAPADTGLSFNGYYIYSATSPAGPFTVIDSIFNYNNTTYNHATANVLNTPRYYYLRTFCVCGLSFSINSDTLQAMRLVVNNVGGVAQLTWNPIHVPALTSSAPRYHIYKEYPAGVWALVDSTVNTNINLPILVCSDSINFRVHLNDVIGCDSKSTIDGATFVDNTVPDPPSLRCVTVNGNGSTILSWIAPVDTGLDFNSYHIYSSNNAGGPFTLIDSIFNYNTLSYTHATANAYATPLYYTVKSRTGCGVEYSLDSDTLQAIRLDVTNPLGGQIANLNWNAMHVPNLPTSAAQYNVYREFPAGTWTLRGTTAALNYLDSNPVCVELINYRIELTDASGCISVSTIDGETFIDNTVPDAPSLRCVTVNANGSTTLSWIAPVDTGLDFNSYHIYSSNNAGGPFTLIDSIFNYNTLSYTHATANAYATPLYYTVKSRTGCGVEYSLDSDTLQAIRLDVTNPLGGQIANLNWNAMHVPNLPTSAAQYNVYREFPAGTWTLRGTTAALNYLDSNPVCVELINYRIELTDASGCISVSTIDGETFIDNTVPDAPSLRCVTVNANGSTTLSWIAPVDTGLDFNSYHIYSSNNAGGPFTLIDSIFNYNTLSYTHATANAYATPLYYTVKSRTGCGVEYSLDSDTLQAIRLDVTNPLGGQIANLNWNAMHVPNLPTSAAQYNVYREFPAGTWTLRGTTAALNYLDSNPVCVELINYRIELTDASGCISVSTIDGETFIDNTVPDAPSLRCVTVNANGSTTLSWIAPVDTGLDFNSYHIYSSNNAGGPFTLIDSIFNYNTLSYTHATANAYATPLYYTVKSRTGCGVEYSLDSDTLQAIRLDVTNPLGGQIANLNWNAMHVPNLPTSAAQYNVYREFPAGTWTLRGTTAALNYLDSNPVCVELINYRIELTDASGCISVSTIDGETFIDNTVPDAPSLRCVTVNGNGSTTLSWIAPVDTGLDFNSYHIYSSNNAGGPFTLIDSIFNYNTLSYTHATANAYATPLYYTVKSRTGCGVEYSLDSDTLQAIRLDVTNPLGGQIANLNWNAMHVPNLPTSAAQYNVYREFPAGTWTLRGTTAALNYLDSNPVCVELINYRIELTDASGCISVSTIDGETFIDNTVPDAPSLRCVTVNANGSTTLSWIAPVDTGLDFNSYHIYSSNNAGGPFTLIDSIFNYNTLSYTHATANAYATPLYYTVKSRTGCGVEYSLDSDTLQAIRLDVTNPLGGQIANLNWNAMHVPNLPTSAAQYNVYREFPAGTWTLRGTTAALNYLDSNPVCVELINYRIELTDASGCISVSTIDGETFIDNTVPDAPSLRCVTIDANGQAQLSWIQPVDTGLDFNSYHISFGTSANGPFNVIDSVFNYNTTTYLHTSANANTTNIYYYVQSRTGCGVEYSLPSDTLHGIKLNVTNVGSTGVANLNWNELHNPLLPSSEMYYKVFREYPTGSWTLLDSTTQLTYVDTINLCDAFINYRIEIGDASGCNSVSSIDGDQFQDITPPLVTVFDSVSVNPINGNVNISWLPNASGDAVGYIIYLFNGASWDSIGNAPLNQLSYLYAASNANTTSEIYNIAAYDSCSNLAPLGVFNNTILLRDSLDKCNASIVLRWNEYRNMTDGLQEYQIYMSQNNGPFNIIGTVPAGTYIYEHTGIKKDSSYCYYVSAVSNTNSRKASSNLRCRVADVLVMPEFHYLKRVTVDQPGQVLIESYVDTAADVSRYELLRSDNGGTSYTVIAQQLFAGQTEISFIDNTAQTDGLSHLYKVVDVSTCNKPVFESNIGQTILLKTTPFENLVNKLEWNAYIDWSGGVLQYNIYRYYNGIWSAAPIATVPASSLSYFDNISSFIDGTGEFCYLIEAVEGLGNIYNYQMKSESNEHCAVQEPHLYLPNAFTPDGLNPIFKPYMIYYLRDGYQMQVFNRWGQLVFETGDTESGWNGKFKGEPAPAGVYVYHIKVIGANGKIIEKRGTISLLR